MDWLLLTLMWLIKLARLRSAASHIKSFAALGTVAILLTLSGREVAAKPALRVIDLPVLRVDGLLPPCVDVQVEGARSISFDCLSRRSKRPRQWQHRSSDQLEPRRRRRERQCAVPLQRHRTPHHLPCRRQRPDRCQHRADAGPKECVSVDHGLRSAARHLHRARNPQPAIHHRVASPSASRRRRSMVSMTISPTGSCRRYKRICFGRP
jgi:hypothetical protein